MSASPSATEVDAGQAVYTPLTLALYDVVVLRFSCRFAWRCPSAEMLDFYNRHVGARHLDVGVGTGFFLDKCTWPVAQPEVTLLDLNRHSLDAAATRTRRYRPRVVQASVLDPIELGGSQFDSIAMNFLLHCLPGPAQQKAATVARHLAPYLMPGGVLFGSTILGVGVRHNPLGRRLMRAYNKKGIFSNVEDDVTGVERGLATALADVHIAVRGTVALFSARKQ
jgi:SAM-dependent methyltransferase